MVKGNRVCMRIEFYSAVQKMSLSCLTCYALLYYKSIIVLNFLYSHDKKWYFILTIEIGDVYRRSQNIRRGAPQISSTPPTAQTAEAIGLILGWEQFRGIEVASPWRFLDFHLEPQKIGPLWAQGSDPRGGKKSKKIFRWISTFL